jgi:hypothetical protein
VLAVFGSALNANAHPRDLDVAVRFAADGSDVLLFLDELAEIARTNQFDVIDLRRAGPCAGCGTHGPPYRVLSRWPYPRARPRSSRSVM